MPRAISLSFGSGRCCDLVLSWWDLGGLHKHQLRHACGAADGSALGKLPLGAAKGVPSGSPPGTGGGSQTPY